jgi:PAS domain S-box-containing protein
MGWPYNLYPLALVAAGMLCGAFGVYAWRRREAQAARAFAVLTLGAALWALAGAAESSITDSGVESLRVDVEYVGAVSVPVAWLAFALEYTGRGSSVTRRRIALLALVPVFTLLAVWTNPLHGLFWTSRSLEIHGGLARWAVTHGPLFWVHVGYSYSLMLLGTAVVVALFASAEVYRSQVWSLLAAVSMPWAASALYVTGRSPVGNLDLTPLAFTLSGLMFGWSMFRFRFLDLLPVAHKAVVETMWDGLVVLDAQKRVVHINPAARRAIGIESGETVGRRASEVLSAWPDWEEALATEAQTEIRLGSGDACRDYEVRVSWIGGAIRRPGGFVILIHDITGRKRAERLKDELLSIVAHDFAAPLTVIQGNAEILLDQVREDDARRMLSVIDAQTKRLAALAADVLTLSRIEGGCLPLEIVPFDLAALLRTVAQERSATTTGRIEVDAPEDAVTVAGDAARIHQIVDNLVGNAIKYSARGAPITVGLRTRRGHVEVSVVDQGPGIPLAELPRLFQKFSRLEIHRQIAPGSGLGLYICRSMTEAHGGRIWAESERGKGSVFRFSLPWAGQASS